MIIQISDNRRIFGGKHDWALQRRGFRKGKPCWESFKYYSSFGGALESAVHEEIRLHPARTLAEAIDAVADVVRRYNDLIPVQFRFIKPCGFYEKPSPLSQD
ncbi:MAG: hypothetical protein AAGM16_06800 [Pseudomonadota bacterium]